MPFYSFTFFCTKGEIKTSRHHLAGLNEDLDQCDNVQLDTGIFFLREDNILLGTCD